MQNFEQITGTAGNNKLPESNRFNRILADEIKRRCHNQPRHFKKIEITLIT